MITLKLGYLILAYFAVINLIAFLLMAVDKRKAKKEAYRIPEASLFASALLGGALGSCAGMLIFHHKTNHWYFQVFMPLIAILYFAAALVWALWNMGWL